MRRRYIVSHAAGITTAVAHKFAGGRTFARGRPYTPLGTVQDFTSSPHHTRFAEMQRELDEMNGRPPSHLYEGPTVTTAQGARPLFERDMREDPMNDDLPEHYVAARQRMMTMQSDSYGESIRGVVSPPPPPDLNAPREYHQQQAELGAVWWTAITLIVIAFFLMVKFGR
ncbi:uncharacterized protein TM35_000591100 [Trypanosoma theileri]|uniref:Uncharacterized protein n=1 Tax=Trypanosoma theileri TaxID=67003 RepID=A0A1X0NGS3_9TRYP|nr:uncharacterized protein TM35_000591100 [Trypanosoma theileri]ORC83718.1 hypothetical protein TM35_000591100 [Trypanosoma theileri]